MAVEPRSHSPGRGPSRGVSIFGRHARDSGTQPETPGYLSYRSRGIPIMTISNTIISIMTADLKPKDLKKQMALIHELGNFLSASLSLREMLEGAIWKVLAHFDLDAGRIYLMHESGLYLALAAAIGTDPRGMEKINRNEGFTGKAVRNRAFIAQHVSELEEEDRMSLLIRKGFKVVICIPLIVMDNITGVMNLTANRDIELDQEEIDLLITVANHIAIAAHHAKLQKEIENREKTIDFLRTQLQNIPKP
ncbi:putative GAF sensor protein [Syntrophobacter fumaroxidans MPOB]|uniref:Putative GAF sensor protein n=2 Tax=Syntrophobacter TaxID=29526 RepID=A0LIV8_SYNFM|nr:putative GAF sensor protein [Syntrophobacter fumaroxidans MPOB]